MKTSEKEKTGKKNTTAKKYNPKKQLSKKAKILIVAAVAAVVAVAVVLTIHFWPEKTTVSETTWGNTFSEIEIIDDSTIEAVYTCPYIEGNPQFYVENAKGFYMTYVDAEGKTVTINGEIIEAPKYAPGALQNENHKTQGGSLTLKIKLDKKLLNKEMTYNAVLKAGSISYKDADYINEEISAKFSEQSGEVLHFADSKVVVPSNVEISLTKDKEKGYFAISAYIPGVTQYNAAATQNFDAIAKIEYKTDDGRFVRYINSDVEFKEENGNVFLKGSIGLDDLIPGEEYTVTIQKGVFINDDKTVVNDEYVCQYTYVE